tara:strand:- start:133 stop:492 length:360 start_codon:yes stop_codon:yes gene_type:complete
MSNYFYDLPDELQYEICQYIPYKRIAVENYVRDIEEIAMDWYNKTFNETGVMVVNFKRFQENGGLDSLQSNRFKYGVFQYSKEERFFHLLFCYSSGHFKRIAKRWSLKNLGKKIMNERT